MWQSLILGTPLCFARAGDVLRRGPLRKSCSSDNDTTQNAHEQKKAMRSGAGGFGIHFQLAITPKKTKQSAAARPSAAEKGVPLATDQGKPEFLVPGNQETTRPPGNSEKRKEITIKLPEFSRKLGLLSSELLR